MSPMEMRPDDIGERLRLARGEAWTNPGEGSGQDQCRAYNLDSNRERPAAYSHLGTAEACELVQHYCQFHLAGRVCTHRSCSSVQETYGE